MSPHSRGHRLGYQGADRPHLLPDRGAVHARARLIKKLSATAGRLAGLPLANREHIGPMGRTRPHPTAR